MRRIAAIAAVLLSCLLHSNALAATHDDPAIIDAVSPSQSISTAHAVASVPITLTRSDATSLASFSIWVRLSPELTLAGGVSGVHEGTFLSSGGGSTTLMAFDRGDGVWQVDGTTLGDPCGTAALSGTLFSIDVSSASAAAAASVSIDSVRLRDCDNAELPNAPGTTASVTVDNTLPSVTLTAPNGGEFWRVGSSHAVTWNASDAAGIDAAGIDLEYSTTNGATWLPIASGLANSGSYDWIVPSAVSATVVVRVTPRDANGNSAQDVSDAPFTIAGVTATSVVSTLNPASFGASVSFSADVTVTDGGGTPTGTVQFRVDGVDFGTPVAIDGAGHAASGATSTLSVGSHPVEAVYGGSALYAGSTSAPLSQSVTAASSAVSLVADANPTVYLVAVQLTASVTPSGAGGTVTFYDGATPLGSAPVVSDQAGLSVSSLSVGSHTLSAQYGGDASHGASTSADLAHDVMAKIVATASANGVLSPAAGTHLFSLNATPAFTFVADPGYHVASVTVDGGAVATSSPYTFAALSSNHTIDVQFQVNPAVPAIALLAASPVKSDNDGDGTTKIRLTWPAVESGSTVEVWRANWGDYPHYDAGGAPAAPASYPPGAPWQQTTVTASTATDEPATRGYWYYVAYVTDLLGTRSPVSNRTGGTLNYELGDVWDGTTAGSGDNQVNTDDVALLGTHYGLSGAAEIPFRYLDIGPTTDFSVNGRPTTDDQIEFEDLVMFASNYGHVSVPQAVAHPERAADANELALAIEEGAGGTVAARVTLAGAGDLRAIKLQLEWAHGVVEPESFAPGEWLDSQGGLMFSPAPGRFDLATLGAGRAGLAGFGDLTRVTFRRLAPGEARITIATVDARDGANQRMPLRIGGGDNPAPATTRLAAARPNPFRGETLLEFALASPERVQLSIHGIDGRRVRTLASGPYGAGRHQIVWDGRDDGARRAAPGIYYARLTTPHGQWSRALARMAP